MSAVDRCALPHQPGRLDRNRNRLGVDDDFSHYQRTLQERCIPANLLVVDLRRRAGQRALHHAEGSAPPGGPRSEHRLRAGLGADAPPAAPGTGSSFIRVGEPDLIRVGGSLVIDSSEPVN